MNPKFYKNDVKPYCDEDHCGEFDGKRCRKMGARPGTLCHPAIDFLLRGRQAVKAHVICMADRFTTNGEKPQAICLGNVDDARATLERLRRRHYDTADIVQMPREEDRFRRYCEAYVWNIREDIPIAGVK